MLGGITGALLKRVNAVALIRQISMHSLGRADVTLRHAKGKNRRKYSVRMCVAKRTHRYARHEGEKRDNFPDVRPSKSLNVSCPRLSQYVGEARASWTRHI